MTVTNTAATVARNTEIDTKASALDFRLYSIVLLKRQGKSSLKNTVSASSFRGWLESSPSEDERWLRNRSQDSDLYAMQKPGLRLVIGDSLPKSLETRFAWLTKSAELGNAFAMEKLADENETLGSSYPTSSLDSARLSPGLRNSWLLEPVFQN